METSLCAPSSSLFLRNNQGLPWGCSGHESANSEDTGFDPCSPGKSQCLRATKPMLHSFWAIAPERELQALKRAPRAHIQQQEKPPQSAWAPHQRAAPCAPRLESPSTADGDPSTATRNHGNNSDYLLVAEERKKKLKRGDTKEAPDVSEKARSVFRHKSQAGQSLLFESESEEKQWRQGWARNYMTSHFCEKKKQQPCSEAEWSKTSRSSFYSY